MKGQTPRELFLSQSNLDHLTELASHFIFDHQKIRIADVLTPVFVTDSIKAIMVQVANDVRTGVLSLDIEGMNKRVLSASIQNLLRAYQNQASPPTQQAHMIRDVNPPLVEEVAVDKDRLFMEKLQELEVTRNNPIDAKHTKPQSQSHSQSQSGTQDPIKAVSDVLLPQANPMAIPTSISTVFMPTPAKKGQELVINSWQRNWIQYPQRNAFQWNGPLPPFIDFSATRVASIMVPQSVLKKSPYIVLQFEGAGGNMSQAIVVPDTSSSMHSPWICYRPIMESFGYFKSIACPWIVKAFTANGVLLPLGSDGGTVSVMSHDQLVVSDLAIRTIDIEDQLWVFGQGGEVFWCEVSEIQRDVSPFWIRYKHDEGATFKSVEGSLLNFSKQWSIILDVPRAK